MNIPIFKHPNYPYSQLVTDSSIHIDHKYALVSVTSILKIILEEWELI